MQFPTRPQPPGISGQFPLPAGQVLHRGELSGQTLTDFEKKELAALGWQPGTPIPSLEEQRKAVAAAATVALPVDPATAPPPLKPPAEVDISRMPPQYQAEMADWLAQLKRTREAMTTPPPPPPTAPPPPPPVAPPPTTAKDPGPERSRPRVATEDAVDYLRTVLGRRPFIREYSLLGGNLAVRFKMAEIGDEAEALTLPDGAREVFLALRSLVAYRLNNGPWTVARKGETELPVGLIVTAYRQFSQLCSELAAAGDDENFWTAIARSASYTAPTSPGGLI